MRRYLIGKTLALVVVVLFIGVSVHPAFAVDTKTSITSNQNNVLVETTIEICKPDGNEKQTILLTKEHSNQLDILIDGFKSDLDNSKSLEESIQIYEDMILSLDNIGLFQDISVEELKDLIISDSIRSLCDVDYPIRNMGKGEVLENRNCLTSGETTGTSFMSSSVIGFQRFFNKIAELAYYFKQRGFEDIASILVSIYNLMLPMNVPFIFLSGVLNHHLKFKPINNGIALGKSFFDFSGDVEHIPSQGWISTDGEYGNLSIEGTLYGYILFVVLWLIPVGAAYIAAEGFTGIKINRGDIEHWYYMGNAKHVKVITEIPPEF
jgi:hypothetical protein